MPSKYHRPSAKNQRIRTRPQKDFVSMQAHQPDDRPSMVNHLTAKTWHTCLTVMVTARTNASMTFADKATVGMSTWDADRGAGVKRTSRTAKEPMGFTARTKADTPPPVIGLSEAALRDLHAQRAWAR